MSDNSSIVDLSKERVRDINLNTPKLATHFYINSKKKVNYYRSSAFKSHFEVYNRGTDRWEYAATIDEDRLRALPAVSREELEGVEEDDLSIAQVLALGSVKKAEEYAASVDDTQDVDSEVVVTNILCNTTQEKTVEVTPRRVKVQLPLSEQKKEEGVKTSSHKLLDPKTLITLFTSYLPEGFLLRFTPKEINYFASYNYDSKTWVVDSTKSLATAGTIYTNSLTCIHKVVDELNCNGYTL